MNSCLIMMCTQKTGASFSFNPEESKSDGEIISIIACRSSNN